MLCSDLPIVDERTRNPGMDQKIIEKHFSDAERQVSIGRSLIVRQRETVYRLERDCHYAGEAKRLLATFEELQNMHVADRDRLLKELASAKA
jgi:hypothetical protein